MGGGSGAPRARLAELVAALSLGVDLGFGQPMEHVLRQCLIALRLAGGFGRENAVETLHEFVRSKNIRVPSGRGVVPVWPPRDS